TELQNTVLRLLNAFVPEAEDFILDHMETLSPKNQAALVQHFAWYDHWTNSRRLPAILENLTTPDHDSEVRLAAFETMKTLHTMRERALVEQLLASTQGEAREKLAIKDEQLMDLEKGVTLPGYLRHIPPVFTVKTSG